ncbi:hypothetical protein [Bacillus sp. FJAT-44742]|uniref:hypothetical protein n=1 Tax=Bacillus sp. FJAT-44742 TaxID=2014005 RepID=UPI000C240E57|nr:hypothetical protein [Bacillus sp. FJAT-44742]
MNKLLAVSCGAGALAVGIIMVMFFNVAQITMNFVDNHSIAGAKDQWENIESPDNSSDGTSIWKDTQSQYNSWKDLKDSSSYIKEDETEIIEKLKLDLENNILLHVPSDHKEQVEKVIDSAEQALESPTEEHIEKTYFHISQLKQSIEHL